MVEEHMEAAGGAEQVLLNIIRVRDQAIMVIEVMVGEMGGPRFTKVWMEMRVHINCWPLHLATASHQIRIQTYEFKYVTTPSVTDDKASSEFIGGSGGYRIRIWNLHQGWV